MSRPDLAGVLKDLPWAVVGAVAAGRYMPERTTADIDIVVLPSDLEEVRRRFREAGYQELGKLAIGGFSWRAPEGATIDVIEGREAWWPEAIAEARENVDARGFPILSLPFLCLMKLLASRVQDIADVSRMLGRASVEDLDRVRSVVRTWAPDLLEDLESLITLGRLEMQGGEENRPVS